MVLSIVSKLLCVRMHKLEKSKHEPIITQCNGYLEHPIYTVDCICGWGAMESETEHNLPWVTADCADALHQWINLHYLFVGSIKIHMKIDDI